MANQRLGGFRFDPFQKGWATDQRGRYHVLSIVTAEGELKYSL